MFATISLLFAVFIACSVEVVETVTIVLAVGMTRQWRATWVGVAAGTVVLAIVIAIAGPAILAIPISTLRLVVGTLMLLFGLQWLRKAVLRGSGLKSLHDEEKIFAESVAAAQLAGGSTEKAAFDGYAFVVAFKAVLLEGLEVAFIVVTFGASEGHLLYGTLAALAAVLVVSGAAFAIRKPLARVPENTLKFVVGVLITAYGTFWAAEGAGVKWPGGDLAIAGLLVFYAAAAYALTTASRTDRPRASQETITHGAAS